MESDKKIPDDPTSGKDGGRWILWVFYFNPNDKRLFPPKRTGLGWTVNFANPYSVACLVLLIALLAILHKFVH